MPRKNEPLGLYGLKSGDTVQCQDGHKAVVQVVGNPYHEVRPDTLSPGNRVYIPKEGWRTVVEVVPNGQRNRRVVRYQRRGHPMEEYKVAANQRLRKRAREMRVRLIWNYKGLEYKSTGTLTVDQLEASGVRRLGLRRKQGDK